VKRVVSLHRQKGRKDQAEYLIEGTRFVHEAFLRKAPIQKIYYTALGEGVSTEHKLTQTDKRANRYEIYNQAISLGIAVEEVSEIVMRKMSATEEPQGILAVVKKSDAKWEDIQIDPSTILLIIDGIQDPGNLGTIFRTALAADVKQIILTKGTVDLHNPKVLRSSMGAIFSQTILTDRNPEEIVDFCNDHSCTLAVSSMEGHPIFNTTVCDKYPLAFVIGNEGSGVSEYIAGKAEKSFSIPMFNNVESLNAAIATGIFLYELRRQVQFL